MDTTILPVDLIKRFLAEDIAAGDITSSAIFDRDLPGEGAFIAKDSFICCGIEQVAGAVFAVQNKNIEIIKTVADGTWVSPGDRLLLIRGPVIDLLMAERVALNLTQRLCGIATLTAEFVEKIRPLPVQILDTRKTTPGLRNLEKYAVRVGGGRNHRLNLAEGILIKDNHIAASGSIKNAVDRVRRHNPKNLMIEVEAADIQQVAECLACRVDRIMLDNMDLEAMVQAVHLVGGRAELEASGGITLQNVREIAKTGVDFISIGALTHSAPARDISMRIINFPTSAPEHF